MKNPVQVLIWTVLSGMFYAGIGTACYNILDKVPFNHKIPILVSSIIFFIVSLYKSASIKSMFDYYEIGISIFKKSNWKNTLIRIGKSIFNWQGVYFFFLCLFIYLQLALIYLKLIN